MVERLDPSGLPVYDLAKSLVTMDILRAYVRTIFDGNPSAEEARMRLETAARAECLK